MVNHYLKWSWVQEWTTVCTKAITKHSRIINDVSSLQFLWRLWVPWWSMDIDQLNLLPFSSIHLSVSNLQKAFVLAFLLQKGSCLGLQHNQTLHPCFIFNDSACTHTNSTLKHSWVEVVVQLTLVDLAAGYSLSPCAYLPKPEGVFYAADAYWNTVCQHVEVCKMTHVAPLGWQSRESKFGQRARTLIFADQTSSVFNRCRLMGHGPNDGTLWLHSELVYLVSEALAKRMCHSGKEHCGTYAHKNAAEV